MIDITNIKEIEFALENCECVLIPFECFKEFQMSGVTDSSFQKLDCTIVDNGKMSYTCGWGSKTPPLHRLNEYNDICTMRIIYKDGTVKEIDTPWYCDDDEYDISENNDYQKSNLLSFKELDLSIDSSSKRFSILNVLDFNIGSIVKDEKGIEHEIVEIDNEKYLGDTGISLRVINQEFKLVR